jgi:hypothetical protein
MADPKKGDDSARQLWYEPVCTTLWVSPGVMQTRCPTAMVIVLGEKMDPGVVIVTSQGRGVGLSVGASVGPAVGVVGCVVG